jgi:hypothetical protein
MVAAFIHYKGVCFLYKYVCPRSGQIKLVAPSALPCGIISNMGVFRAVFCRGAYGCSGCMGYFIQ